MTDKTSIQYLPETENVSLTNYNPSTQTPQYMHNFPENHRLPSRDIAINPNDYINDNQIRANYIPPGKKIKDYLKNHREEEYLQSRLHQGKKTRKLLPYQDFILLSVMMFLFQMSIVNTTLHTYCHSLGIHELEFSKVKIELF